MRNLVLAGAAALLCGCQSISDYMERKTDYRSSGPARTLPPLEVPPDLTTPERDGRYIVPEQQTEKSSTTFSGYQAERRERATGTPPPGGTNVLPAFDSMKVERAGTIGDSARIKANSPGRSPRYEPATTRSSRCACRAGC